MANNPINMGFVLTELKLVGPATVSQITQVVADDLNMPFNAVREIVVRALQGGVETGYVQKKGNKYHIYRPKQRSKWTLVKRTPGKKDTVKKTIVERKKMGSVKKRICKKPGKNTKAIKVTSKGTRKTVIYTARLGIRAPKGFKMPTKIAIKK